MLTNMIFFIFACSDTYQNLQSSHLKSEKKIELNEKNELEYRKTLSQMNSYAPKYVFLNLHAQTCIKTIIYLSYFKTKKKD